MAELAPGLQAQQRRFTAYLRDPQQAPAPDLEPRRLAVYRRLVFNNLRSLLGSGFPVCVRLLGEADWTALVHRYLASHVCRTPLFTELAAEFVQWLQEHDDLPHPALAELAHYEWVETALYQHPATPLPAIAVIDPLRVPLQRSALAWPLLYRWPVHLLGNGAPPTVPPTEPTGLLVRRDADGVVRFASLTPLAAQLLERLGNVPGETGVALLHTLAERNHLPADALVQDGTLLLRQFLRAGIIGPVAPLPPSAEGTFR